MYLYKSKFLFPSWFALVYMAYITWLISFLCSLIWQIYGAESQKHMTQLLLWNSSSKDVIFMGLLTLKTISNMITSGKVFGFSGWKLWKHIHVYPLVGPIPTIWYVIQLYFSTISHIFVSGSTIYRCWFEGIIIIAIDGPWPGSQKLPFLWFDWHMYMHVLND